MNSRAALVQTFFLLLLFALSLQQSRKVSYDNVAVTIDNERKLILSGSIHYPRSTPQMWPSLFKKAIASGLNTIETYVFWALHEPEHGKYDFTGNLDLLAFVKLAQEMNLDVIIRIGPYICAEFNYGGFPAWLREIPDIQFRTYNAPYMKEMARWVSHVVEYLRPLFASNGGNIILLQIENEYGNVIKYFGPDGQKYLSWCADFANELDAGIPWIMCEGYAGDTLGTVNGFYGHERLKELWKVSNFPGIWTENWPGWYDNWSYGFNLRPAADVAYAVARFYAMGGTGMNYYMYHGGTNFGRTGSYLITQTYDYDAPLDEFGVENEPKYSHLTALHQVLLNNQNALLYSYNTTRPTPQPLGPKQVLYSFSKDGSAVVFLCNDDEKSAATVSFKGRFYALPARSVIILDSNQRLLYNSSAITTPSTQRNYERVDLRNTKLEWWSEPTPGSSQQATIVVSDKPIEVLSIHHDQSDYAFYVRNDIQIEQDSIGSLSIDAVADIAHVFFDGEYINSTKAVLPETRGNFNGTGFAQTVLFAKSQMQLARQKSATHQLVIMTCTLGLTKYEEQVKENLANDRRGIWSNVFLQGRTTDITTGKWIIQAGLVGENLQIYDPANFAKVTWTPAEKQSPKGYLTWYKLSFDLPSQFQDSNSPLVLDLAKLKKGIVYINGKSIGRYWLSRAQAHMTFDPIVDKGLGQPTQRYYHVPREWLRRDANELVFFEELDGAPNPSDILYSITYQ